jgi:hypothetical protein
MTVFSDLEEEAQYIIDRQNELNKLIKQHRKKIIERLHDQSLTRPDVDRLSFILSMTDKQDA